MNDRDKDNNEYFTDEDYLDMAGTASASDCTGLISQGCNETDSADEYNDIYKFGIPHVAAKATGKSLGKTSTSSSDELSSRAPITSANRSPSGTAVNSYNQSSDANKDK